MHKAGFFLENIIRVINLKISNSAWIGPATVSFMIADSCDDRCIFCGDYSPYSENLLPFYNKEPIGVDRFRKVIRDLKDSRVKKIIFGGQGEPLCNPHIADFIKISLENNLQVLVRTNGISLEKKCKDLAYSGKVHYEISLHAAHPGTWQSIHTGRTAKDFQEILDYIGALPAKLRKNISFINVICKLNYQEAPDIIRLAYSLGVKEAYFQLAIDRGLNELGKSKVSPDVPESTIMLEKALEAGKSARRLKIKTNLECIIAQVKNKLNDPEEYAIKNPENAEVNHACYVGYFNSLISSEGNVLPCCNFGEPLGNIKASSFGAIWNSPQYRDFRGYGREMRLGRIPSCIYGRCQYYGLNKRLQKVLFIS